MKPDERDLAYLWDMLDAVGRIGRLTAGLDYAAFVVTMTAGISPERMRVPDCSLR
jgi:hypothetical protein